MRRERIGVLADDLTGAMDAGMQVLSSGLRCAVAVGGRLPENCDVLVYDTESRNVPDARARAVQAAKALLQENIPLYYKKIDSTLRGHVGAEIGALLDEKLVSRVLVAPALPQSGRTTVGGVHYVFGVPLDRTELAKDPFAPVTTSDIGALIRQGCDYPTALLPIDVVQKGVDAAKAALEALFESAPIVVADALTQADLETLALAAPVGTLLCGSAGLFAYLPKRLGRTGTPQRVQVSACDQPVLALCGSPAKMSKAQMAQVQKTAQEIDLLADNLPECCGKTVYARVDAGALAQDALEKAADQAVHTTQKLLLRGCDVCIDLSGAGKEALAAAFAGDEAALRAASGRVQFLAQKLAKGLQDHYGALVIFGGDTALSVLSALDCGAVNVLGACEPLIPKGKMAGGPADGKWIVTKAGGFGSENTLLNILSQF